MVRSCRPALRRHDGARAVLLFDADAVPAHKPREFAASRLALAGGLRALVLAPCGCAGIGRRTRAPPDANSLSCAWPFARQSDRRVSDGDVFGERRTDQ